MSGRFVMFGVLPNAIKIGQGSRLGPSAVSYAPRESQAQCLLVRTPPAAPHGSACCYSDDFWTARRSASG